MTNKANEKPADVIKRLEKLLDQNNQDVFNKDETELLKKLAKFFIALTTLGKPGMVILKILGYGAAMIIAFAAFKSGLGELLRSLFNG